MKDDHGVHMRSSSKAYLQVDYSTVPAAIHNFRSQDWYSHTAPPLFVRIGRILVSHLYTLLRDDRSNHKYSATYPVEAPL